MKVMMVFNGLNSVMALLAAIVLYSTYLGAPDAKWSIYVAGAICAVIAVHQAISFGFALDLRLRSRRMKHELSANYHSGNTDPLGQIEGSETRHILDLPNVTENTTELLQEAPRPSAITKPQG